MFNKIRNLFNDRFEKTKGFTVIEIAVVVVMIVIATSIAAPNFAGFNDDADAEIIQAELSTVHSVATNLAKEEEVNIDQFFKDGTSQNKQLKNEIKSVTNFNNDKIDKYEFGVDSKGSFVVHVKDKKNVDFSWDGQKLETGKTITKIDKNVITNNKLFETTGGYIPNLQEFYFTYKDGDPKIITGLTQLGREYFNGKIVIPAVNEMDTVTPIKGIMNNTFNKERLTSVYIPPSVTTIGVNSFRNNGASNTSNSIQDDIVENAKRVNFHSNKYFNGHIGQWNVVGNKWVKEINQRDILMGERLKPQRVISGVNYTIPVFHKATAMTRNITAAEKPQFGLRPVVDGSHAAGRPDTPGRLVTSSITGSGGVASGTINTNNQTDVGEHVVFQGRPKDFRDIRHWKSGAGWTADQPGKSPATKNYNGHLAGDGTKTFPFVGVMTQDTVINGGTPAGENPVSNVKHPTNQNRGNQPESWTHSVNPGLALNTYTGVVKKQSVIDGTPAGHRDVTAIKGPGGISDKVGPATVPNTMTYSEGSAPNVMSGTLTKYVYSGTPYHQKDSGIQSTPNYNSAGYVGTLPQYSVISGTDTHTKWVTDQASASYSDAGGYKGTLSKYDKKTGTITPSKSVTGTNSQESIETFLWTSTGTTWSNQTRHQDRYAEKIFGQWDGHQWANAKPDDRYRVDYNPRRASLPTTLSGYSGNLPYQRESNSRVYTDVYNKKSKTSADVLLWTNTVYATYSGSVSKSSMGWVLQSTVYAKNLYPATISYNSGGYKGTLSKNSGGDTYNSSRTTQSGNYKYVYYKRTQSYSGTVYGTPYDTFTTRYQGNVTRPDTRKWNYRGTVTRPDTQVWRYSGRISKLDTRLWYYSGTLNKLDTRTWDYKGRVTADTREWEYWYYYRVVIE